jgi:hypothetical protein
VVTGQRDVRQLASYMASRPFRYFSYGDQPASYFSRTARRQYFNAIPQSALSRSVVFFDPDNGLEPEKSCTDAHLKYEELASVFARMDDSSAAVVYQHLPRRAASVFWPALSVRLRDVLQCSAGYLAAGDVGFLVALRNPRAEAEAASAMEKLKGLWSGRLLIARPDRSV